MKNKRMLVATLTVLLVLGAGAGISGASETDASWTTEETGTATATAATFGIPRTLSCAPLSIVLQPTFSWLAPSTGITPPYYHWIVATTGGTVVESGDVTTTSVQLPTPGLLSLGSYKVSVMSESEPGGWTSAASSTGSYTVITSLLTLCSVP